MAKEKISYELVEQRVLEYLRDNPKGLHIQKLVDMTGFQRYAIRLALAKFEGMGEVEVVKVGMAQLYRLGRSVVPSINDEEHPGIHNYEG